MNNQTSPNEPRRLLTAREACKYLSVSDRTLFTLTDSGRLPVVRMGLRCLRYDVDDLNEFIRKCKAGEA